MLEQAKLTVLNGMLEYDVTLSQNIIIKFYQSLESSTKLYVNI